MEQFRHKLPGFLVKYFERYCAEALGTEPGAYTPQARVIFDRLMDETPDMGVKGNMMSSNIDMTAAFFAYYEASGHRIGGEAIDVLINRLYEDLKWVGFFTDMNRRPYIRPLYYRVYRKHAAEVERRQANGEWLGTWRFDIDPDGKTEGISYHMSNCPLLAFARMHNYEHMMPYICRFDFIFEKFLHAKLIRTQTEATGGAYCDYWFVPDKSATAEEYRDFRSV